MTREWIVGIKQRRLRRVLLAVLAMLTVLVGSDLNAQAEPGVTRVPVVFSGGHETDPRDRAGRWC